MDELFFSSARVDSTCLYDCLACYRRRENNICVGNVFLVYFFKENTLRERDYRNLLKQPLRSAFDRSQQWLEMKAIESEFIATIKIEPRIQDPENWKKSTIGKTLSCSSSF